MKNPISSLIEYLRSARAELEKVTWPSRQETLRYSLLVVGVSAAMAAFFFVLDFGLSKGIDLALKRQNTTQTAPPVQPTTSELEDNLGPDVQGFDAEGNPVDIKVTPVPIEGAKDEGGITITP